MADQIEQNCPLCDNAASYKGVEFGRFKYFSCDVCTQFQISKGAEKRVGNSTANWRSNLSEMAKNTPENKLLLITLPDPSRKASEGLVAEYHPFSEIPK